MNPNKSEDAHEMIPNIIDGLACLLTKPFTKFFNDPFAQSIVHELSVRFTRKVAKAMLQITSLFA